LYKPLSAETQLIFLRELEILAEHKHPGALQLIGFNFAGYRSYGLGPAVLTAFMENGDLASVLFSERAKKPRPGWDATAKSKCIFGLAATMAYFHRKHIIHRDFKPANILLNGDYEPVIADFGHSRFLDAAYAESQGLGSALFNAPERDTESARYSFPVDVYAYGVTLFVLFSDSDVLDDTDASRAARLSPFRLYMKIAAGARLKRVPQINDYYWSLIARCWSHFPSERPEFADIVEGFRSTHLYILDGADRRLVIAYEEKMMEFLKPDDSQFELELKQLFDSWDERNIAVIS
jgi:serine/threonine protein kinase